jgi:hypothetical protein
MTDLTRFGIVEAFNYKTLPADVADCLRQHADKIRQTAITAIIEIGNDLIEARQHLEHGQFIEWVETACDLTYRSAANYMSAARFAKDNVQRVAHLSAGVIYKLAAKSTPPEVVSAVITSAMSGAVVTNAEVQAKLDEARFQKRLTKKQERRSAIRSTAAKAGHERRAKAESNELRVKAEEKEAQLAAKIFVEKWSSECARDLLRAERLHLGLISYLRQLLPEGEVQQ